MDIFYIHSTQLTQLNCHCIFTFPIPLLYNIMYRNIVNNYDGDFVLPMIKVYGKDGGEWEAGINAMSNIVSKRMELNLFRDLGSLRTIIRWSGGCISDLFDMVVDAADSALNDGRKVIDETDCRAAYKKRKATYENTIAEDRDRGIAVDDYYRELVACATDKIKKPGKSALLLDLMNNLTVLTYNDENWCDVHPIVRDILKERGLIQDDR